MNLLLNIIWLICGGFLICVEYIVSSLLLMITIVGIPFGMQTMKIAGPMSQICFLISNSFTMLIFLLKQFGFLQLPVS